jgi:DNA-binding transcriptional regulator YdaS (Cro superfamily)
METSEVIREAIDRIGLTVLAGQLGESIQVVSNWRLRGSVPANRCVAFERATGVPRSTLRPKDWRDYWPELVGTEGAPPAPQELRDAA